MNLFVWDTFYVKFLYNLNLIIFFENALSLSIHMAPERKSLWSDYSNVKTDVKREQFLFWISGIFSIIFDILSDKN